MAVSGGVELEDDLGEHVRIDLGEDLGRGLAQVEGVGDVLYLDEGKLREHKGL